MTTRAGLLGGAAPGGQHPVVRLLAALFATALLFCLASVGLLLALMLGWTALVVLTCLVGASAGLVAMALTRGRVRRARRR